MGPGRESERIVEVFFSFFITVLRPSEGGYTVFIVCGAMLTTSVRRVGMESQCLTVPANLMIGNKVPLDRWRMNPMLASPNGHSLRQAAAVRRLSGERRTVCMQAEERWSSKRRLGGAREPLLVDSAFEAAVSRMHPQRN